MSALRVGRATTAKLSLVLDCSGLSALAGKEPTKVSNPVFQSHKNSLT